MQNCKSSELPMQPKLQLNDSNDTCIQKPYKELLGCLIYIMQGTRPDISYCITYFSQFQNCFSNAHWEYLKGVLRYLKLTEKFVLKFKKKNYNNINLIAYADSDFANSKDRKSVTGYVIKLNGNAISWRTKKQEMVSLSSAEAEYIALSVCITESLFVAQMLSEILNKNMYPIHLYEDNQACIKMSTTLETKRTKHIDIKYQFVKDCVSKGQIKLNYIPTEQQQGDIFTKALPKIKFKYLRNLLNLE